MSNSENQNQNDSKGVRAKFPSLLFIFVIKSLFHPKYIANNINTIILISSISALLWFGFEKIVDLRALAEKERIKSTIQFIIDSESGKLRSFPLEQIRDNIITYLKDRAELKIEGYSGFFTYNDFDKLVTITATFEINNDRLTVAVKESIDIINNISNHSVALTLASALTELTLFIYLYIFLSFRNVDASVALCRLEIYVYLAIFFIIVYKLSVSYDYAEQTATLIVIITKALKSLLRLSPS